MAAPGRVGSLVSESRVARLATVDETGYPHLVPVCYATDGRRYYSALDAKPKRVGVERLRRVRNIEANPRVALLFDHYAEDWRQLRYVMVQGRAELLRQGPEWEAARSLLLDKYPQYRSTTPLPESGPMIKITPERVLEWTATA